MAVQVLSIGVVYLLVCHLLQVDAISNTKPVPDKGAFYPIKNAIRPPFQNRNSDNMTSYKQKEREPGISGSQSESSTSPENSQLYASSSHAYASHHNHPTGTGYASTAYGEGLGSYSSAGTGHGYDLNVGGEHVIGGSYFDGGHDTTYDTSHNGLYDGDKGYYRGHYSYDHYPSYKPHGSGYHGHGDHGGHGFDHHSDHGHGYGHDHSHKEYYHFKKAIALKSLLVPLAGVALLGAAAALVTNPVLLQLGVLSGKRRRRRSITSCKYRPEDCLDSTIYPANDHVRPVHHNN